jgi:hypothetical protein
MIQTLFQYGRARVSCVCPRCGLALRAEDINIAADCAFCAQCKISYCFSELAQNGDFLVYDLNDPPEGASFHAMADGFQATATTWSADQTPFLLFAVVWLGLILRLAYGAALRPAPINWHDTLIGLPFVLVALVVLLQFGVLGLMRSFGRVSLVRSGGDGVVFEGFGRFGWTRRFRWSQVNSVREAEASSGRRRGKRDRLIELNFKPATRSSLRFGTLLSDERRWFLISVLRAQLPPKN